MMEFITVKANNHKITP